MRRLILLTLFLITFGITSVVAANAEESAYERVMRTKTLRCGYILGVAPEMMKDANTGKLSGISYDLIEEIGKRLDLKIDWSEEVGFGTMTAGLKAGRYDAVCFTLYRDTRRAPVGDFTVPLFYNAQGMFVRTDDTRFDKDKSLADKPAITIATVDGEMSQYIAAQDFPNAQTLSLPQSTDLAQMLENVATRKADVAFVNTLVALGYMKSNPGKLKEIHADSPIRVFSHGFLFDKGQYDLVKTIDITLEEMLDQGFVDKVLTKYDPQSKAYMRLKKPY